MGVVSHPDGLGQSPTLVDSISADRAEMAAVFERLRDSGLTVCPTVVTFQVGAQLNAARFMGLDDRLGTIAEGKSASMVLVGAIPLDDVGNAAAIEAVFLRGQYFDADDLGVMLAEAREIVASSRS